MQTYLIQVILGNLFEDLRIEAATMEDAITKAKQVVASTPELVIFKHRYTRYVG